MVLANFDLSGLLQKVTLWKKLYVLYSFFFVRKIVGHIVTFSFYCVVLPMTVLVPEVEVPIWGAIYIPSVITILNSVGTPRFASPSYKTDWLNKSMQCTEVTAILLQVTASGDYLDTF